MSVIDLDKYHLMKTAELAECPLPSDEVIEKVRKGFQMMLNIEGMKAACLFLNGIRAGVVEMPKPFQVHKEIFYEIGSQELRDHTLRLFNIKPHSRPTKTYDRD